MNITREYFGTTSAGKQVDVISIENSSGASIELITYGARLISCKMPDRKGTSDELVLGSKDLADYEGDLLYHGATIGRYANRIAKGTFTLNGIEHNVEKNHPLFQLHGGPGGFHQLIWDAYPIKQEDRGLVKFTLTSPDGDQGFPGTLDVAVTVTLTEMNELMFFYEAVTDADTYISLTNHAYWNVSGLSADTTIHDHELQLNAHAYVEVGRDLLPTGSLVSVHNTPFDFTKVKTIGKDLHNIPGFDGFDHNFVVRKARAPQVIDAAVVFDPPSGRKMTIRTNAPGVQFYSDIYSQPPYRGICLEAGELPDAMHHSNFPQPLLTKGGTYRQLTIHSFETESGE